MADHYTYLSHFIHDHDWQKFTAALVLGGGMMLLARSASKRLVSAGGTTQVVVPSDKISFHGVIDLFVECFVNFQDTILGKENRKYLPFTGTIFLFLLLANVIGLIPGMPAITTTNWVTVGLPIVVYVYFNYLGIKEHGLKKYLQHFCGPVIVLAPFLFALEFFFTLPLRVLTLNLRLYWNITADHIVVDIFHGLVPYVLPGFLYILGTFVSFMQAFIFTTLTMIYILLAVQHEEGHDEEHGHSH